MYTIIYVYDFPSPSSKLSSRNLRVGNKELLHTTQLQTALYTASGERRQLGIVTVPSCLRIILSSVWFEGNEPESEISVACAPGRLYENRPRLQWSRHHTVTLISHVSSIWCV